MPGLDLPSLAILMRQPPNRLDTVSHLASVRHTTVSMTNPADRVEIITSVQRRRRWTVSEKVWPRGADSRGQRPRGRTGVARCASCNGGLAARRWKPEVLERAVGAKNCCGCRRRPDEGGCGGGTDRVPGRFPVQLVRDLALHAFVRLAKVRIMLKRLVASSSLNALMRARRVAQSAFLRPGWQNLSA